MTYRKKRIKHGLMVIVLATTIQATVLAGNVAVINAVNPTGQITRSEARALFLMRERRFYDGQRVVLVQMPRSSRAHRIFLRDVLGMSPAQYAREWDKLVNSGLSTSVLYVATTEEMLATVSRTENSLGYVDADNLLINAGNSDVKILHITD